MKKVKNGMANFRPIPLILILGRVFEILKKQILSAFEVIINDASCEIILNVLVNEEHAYSFCLDLTKLWIANQIIYS